MPARRDAERREPSAPASPDWLETAFSWASGALVAALLAYLLWDAVREDRPAAFEARAGTPVSVGSAVHVPVTVRNTGDRAAQELAVTVTLQQPGEKPSEASLTFDWLAGRSRRHGVAVFPVGLAVGAQATARVTGFAVP